MILVKFHRDISCPDGVFKSGEEGELSDKIAGGLLEAGYASVVNKSGSEIVYAVGLKEADIETADKPKLKRKK